VGWFSCHRDRRALVQQLQSQLRLQQDLDNDRGWDQAKFRRLDMSLLVKGLLLQK